MRPATAREPARARTDSVRGPAKAVGCRAHGMRFVKHRCRPEGDPCGLAPDTSVTNRSNGYFGLYESRSRRPAAERPSRWVSYRRFSRALRNRRSPLRRSASRHMIPTAGQMASGIPASGTARRALVPPKLTGTSPPWMSRELQGPCTKPLPRARGAVLRNGRNRRPAVSEAPWLVSGDDSRSEPRVLSSASLATLIGTILALLESPR